jgi:hypothetical protein
VVTDSTSLGEIERRLTEAKGPDREIENAIFDLIDTSVHEPGVHAPVYTRSIDCAIALCERVLPHSGIKMNLYRNRDNEWNWHVVIESPDEPPEGEDPDRVFAFRPHPHAALALCLAIVRALIAQAETEAK